LESELREKDNFFVTQQADNEAKYTKNSKSRDITISQKNRQDKEDDGVSKYH
jgi:hypothetical protein